MTRVVLWILVASLAGHRAYAIERARDLPRIGKRPTVIDFTVSEYEIDGLPIVRSDLDVHLVADVPIEAFARVFTNRDRTGEYMPNLDSYEYTPLLDQPGDVVMEIQRAGVRFMGIDATIALRQRSEAFDMLDESPPTFRLEYRMVESLDGKLYSSGGVFLLEEVRVSGRRATYIRQENTTEFKNPFFGFPGILRAFAPIGTRRLYRAMVEEAHRYVP